MKQIINYTTRANWDNNEDEYYFGDTEFDQRDGISDYVKGTLVGFLASNEAMCRTEGLCIPFKHCISVKEIDRLAHNPSSIGAGMAVTALYGNTVLFLMKRDSTFFISTDGKRYNISDLDNVKPFIYNPSYGQLMFYLTRHPHVAYVDSYMKLNRFPPDISLNDQRTLVQPDWKLAIYYEGQWVRLPMALVGEEFE